MCFVLFCFFKKADTGEKKLTETQWSVTPIGKMYSAGRKP